MSNSFDFNYLNDMSNIMRKDIIKMVYMAGSGHPGGSLSVCEILSYLYFYKLCVNPGIPHDINRDRFILSKGHACPALYSALARKGYFPLHWLETLRKIGSPLQGHPDCRKVPGIDISSGSLGMGVSFAVGCCLSAKLLNLSYRTYVLTGCGELDEGQNWEAFMAAAKYKLNNMLVIIDYNKVQLDGTNDEIMPINDLPDRIKAFKWNVLECNGHDLRDIHKAFMEAERTELVPTAIVAHTVKGKGVSFMENRHEWHGAVPNEEEYKSAMCELGGEIEWETDH